MKTQRNIPRKRLDTRLFLVGTGILALLAVLLRIFMFAEVVKTDPFVFAPSDITDMATYQKISDEILRGHIPDEFVYQPFYYAVFLPIVKAVFRAPIWSIGIAQACCVGAIVWFSALCAAMLRSRRTGLVTGVLCEFANLLFFYVPYALIEIQQCMWFTLIFYCILRMMRTGRTKFFVMTGLFLSFAILSRGNAWCFLPVILYAMYKTIRKFRFHPKQTILKTALLVACILLPQMPFVLQNTIHTHTLCGPATAGPAVLTIGNNPDAAPGTLVVPYPPYYDEWMEHQDERSIPGRIFDWFREHPSAFLLHQMEKVWLFFDVHELYNNINPAYNAKGSHVFQHYAIIPTGLLIWLSLCAGIHAFIARRHRREEILLHLCIILYALATAAFYILARFRVPAIGFFAIGSGTFLHDFLWYLRKHDAHKMLQRIAFPIVFASAACFTFFPVYRENYEPKIRRFTNPHGVSLVTADCVRIHDNAPFYNNSWLSYNMKPETLISKQFDCTGIDTSKYSAAYLKITFTTEQSISLNVRCNGKSFPAQLEYISKLGGVTPVPVEIGPMPIPDDFTFHITIPGLSPNNAPGLAVDLHRDFERTVIDETPFPAEAVIELILR